MDLLERFVAGDLDAFETLFREHQRQVYAWIAPGQMALLVLRIGRTGRSGRRRFLRNFRRFDVLLVIHGKQQIVAETVPSMASLSSPVVINLSSPRQPQLHFAIFELYWPIFDGRAIRH